MSFYGFICPVLVLVASCGGAKKTASPPDVVVPAQIPPSQCLVRGIILKIDTALQREDPNSICSKYPCKAMVKVEKLFGCGSGIIELPEAGTEILIRFEHSLHSTKDVQPGMAVHYPGLSEGSEFTALLSQHQVPGGVSYAVSDYKKK